MSSFRIAVVAAAMLAGCGFQPLNTYRASADGARSTAALSAVSVAPIRDRTGQLLRNALIDRLSPRGQPRYTLTVKVNEAIGDGLLSLDSTATRRVMRTTARFELSNEDGQTITVGDETAQTRFDIVRDVNNAFADVSAEKAARRRLLDQLADRIVRRIGFAFARPAA